RGHIPVLDQRIEQVGITEVASLDDVVPLLFPHSVYKSYPEVFVRHRQWERMNTWLDSLSRARVTGVDVDGAQTVDDWMGRLHAAGHYVFATSGTSGKHSYLNQNATDLETVVRSQLPRSIPADQSRAVFILGPREAPNKAAIYFRAF